MKKRMTIMIIALILVFGGIIGFNLFKGFMIKRFFASYEAPAISVSSVTARQKDWEPHINAVGNFVAINGVDITPQVAGNVAKIHFESGQYIESAMPLIDIDDSTDKATLKFNQADMTLKSLSYRRQIDLLRRGATSSSNLDEAKANLEQAQANVEKIEAEIRQKHLSAPFSGQLGIRQVNLGQYVSPGQTSIVTLQSMDPLYLEFNLPEQLFKYLHINQPTTVSLEEFPNLLFEGKITAINAKVDTSTHNILVQATLPNCPADIASHPEKSPLIDLRKETDGNRSIVTCHSDRNSSEKVKNFLFIPGMFATIAIEQPPVPNVIVLPSTAISYSLYGNSVFVLEKNKDRLLAKRVFVTTGEQEGNDTVILSGVKAGQQVVSSGELKLQNGAHVVINNSVELNQISAPDSLSQ